MERRDIWIDISGGGRMAATRWEPDEQPEVSIVVNSALAVGRWFYSDFAAWFAERGFRVWTYDYRGIGASPPPAPEAEVTVDEWVRGDMAAAIRRADDVSGDEPLFLLGHSLGGQVVGLLGERPEVDGLVTFSAQTGYWRLQAPGEEWKVFAGMGLLFPVVTKFLGYLPWSRLFGGEDIPGPVAEQWADWCTNPNYLFDDDTLRARERYAAFSAPVLGYSFEDDAWGHRRAVDWMMDQYTSSEVGRRHLRPSTLGVDAIGHFGFFDVEMEREWRRLAERLEAGPEALVTANDVGRRVRAHRRPSGGGPPG